jgi:hypothetical protein
MLAANVKETTMITELSPVLSRLSGSIEETLLKEAAGKPPTMLSQRMVGNLPWKTVKSSAGTATLKRCRANNPKSSFTFNLV